MSKSNSSQVNAEAFTPLITYNASGQEQLRAAADWSETARDLPWYLHPQWQVMSPLEPGLLTAIGVLMSAVGLAGSAGNFTVLYLVLRHKKLQTSANLYVFNLAVADLIMCMGNFPLLIVSSFAGRWTTGFTGCKIYSFLGGLAGFVSINTLTAMACDRYNVLYRNKGLLKQGSKKHSLGLLVSLWIYSLFWAMPPFFGWGHFALDGGQISCCFDYLNRSASNVSYIIAIFVFCFGIQMLVICFCYGNIVLAVCRNEQATKRANMDILLYQNHCQHSMQHLHNNHRQATASTTAATATFPDTEEERAALSDPAHPNEDTMTVQQLRKGGGRRCWRRRRLEVRVTRLVVFITASFCLSWMPFAVVSLIGVFGNASVVTPIVSVLPGILAKIATVVNPLLYAIGHPQYRNVIFKHYRRSRSHKRAGQGGRGGRGSGGGGGGCDGGGPFCGRGRDHGTGLQTTRGMLSSIYFASVCHDTDSNSDACGVVDTALRLRGAFKDASIV